jgi:hypothetical protein
MKAEKSTMKIANFTIYRIFVKRKILTSNVYEPVALTVKLTARADVLYSIPEIIRFAKGVRVEI